MAIASGNLAGVQLLLTSSVFVCLVSSCSRLTDCKQQLNSSTRTPSAPIVPHNGHTHTRTASSRTTCAVRLSLSLLVAIAIYARAADSPISIVRLPLSLSLPLSVSLFLYISSSCSCSTVRLCCIRKNRCETEAKKILFHLVYNDINISYISYVKAVKLI